MKFNASAKAFANVALVKYFGKRDRVLNLPDASSLSLTLEPLQTVTKIVFDESYKSDKVLFNGDVVEGSAATRISSFLDIARNLKGITLKANVDTTNSFPTAAGLASSASGFAALARAVDYALDLKLDDTALSAYARRGSGSASRSVFGGFVKWQRGEKDDGSDSHGICIKKPSWWDLRMIVGVADSGQKSMGSTGAMNLTKETSPYYKSWIKSAQSHVNEAVEAIEKKDFQKLGEITENSALLMHGAIMGSNPGIMFLKGTTIDAYHLTVEMRKKGLGAYFTCDAGPQPKILCTVEDAVKIERELSMLKGIKKVINCKIGDGAQVIKPYGTSIEDKCSTLQ
ncbi:MAG: diphosphomevalonate decarboxylase [Deltaproteobacteria bacterium]|nr:diphosphomevalonate decarboxylase [Deltaproteobacteria bacterium]